MKPKNQKAVEAKTGVTSLRLDIEWLELLRLFSTGISTGDFIKTLLGNHLLTLPRKEADALRALVNSRTGKTLRIEKPGSSGSVESEIESDPQEGRGAAPGDPIAAINRIGLRASSPLDKAISVTYGEEE